MQYKFKETFVGTLNLSDGIDRPGIQRVQLLKVGKFKHPKAPDGEFEITPGTLFNLKQNFDNNVRRLDKGEIAVDYGHKADEKAAGWIDAVELDEGDTQLWMNVNYTEQAEESILAREWRFLSAEIDFDYKDNETNASLGPTLLGAGLVNRPHIKGMHAIFNEHETNEKPEKEFSMTPEEMMKKIGELEQRILELEGKLKANEGSLQEVEKEKEEVVVARQDLSEEIKKVTSENLKLKETAETAGKEVKFNEYLKEGKVTPAMKEGFMAMTLELAEKTFKDVKALNLGDGHGSGEDKKGETEDKDASDIVDERAAVLRKDNPNLSLGESYSQVLSKDKELAKKYEESTTLQA